MNREQLYAKFYDLEYQNKKDDVDFYYKLAQKIQGKIGHNLTKKNIGSE